MFFDIGSNIGKWSLANINNCNKIIAVEASLRTYDRLIQSVSNNEKIICLNYAVCNNNGEDIVFYDAIADTISTLNKDWLTSSESRFCGRHYNEIKCKPITIDSLIEKYGEPELIKIDVEGGEYSTISSLSKKVNNLCFEWASETNDITINCLDHLKGLGFNYFSIQYEDFYTFRPSEYTNIEEVKELLSKTTPKLDWGMIWCK